jgi:uncharacterized repeat protein (TIGR03943 family)
VKVAVQATVLLLFGVALLKLAVSDQLLLYVRPGARLWVGLADLALLALAGWILLDQVRENTAAGNPMLDGDAIKGHGHGPVSAAMWLVLAPVVAVLVVAPPALGTFSAQRAPAVRVTGTGHDPRLVASSRPVPLGMFEFLLLSAAKPAALRSQQVVLTGFVLRGRAGGFVLARMVITCCAADASAAAVEVNAANPVPAIGSWVRVTGSYTGSEPDVNQTPKLTASSIAVIDQPANPYDH